MLIAVLLLTIFIVLSIYEPHIDILSNNDIVLWYNEGGDQTKRVFKYLYKNEKN